MLTEIFLPTTIMQAIILHLSDSHVQSAASAILSRSTLIAATLRPILSSANAIFIVFTGDLTQSGDADEFKLVHAFLDALRDTLAKEFDGPIEMLVTPGNHDGHFKKSKTTRLHLVQSLRSGTGPAIDADVIDTCVEPLDHYYQFEAQLGTTGMSYSDKLWKEYRYTFGDTTLRFSSINPSWVSTVPEGEALFPVEHYSDMHENAASVNILMMHHPLNWYAQTAYHPLREMAKTNYQLVLSGHEHTSAANIVTDFEKRSESPRLL